MVAGYFVGVLQDKSSSWVNQMKFFLALMVLVVVCFTRAHADARIVITSTEEIENGARVKVGYTVTNWSTSDTTLSACSVGQCEVTPASYVGGTRYAYAQSSTLWCRGGNRTLNLGEVLTCLANSIYKVTIPYSGYAYFTRDAVTPITCLALASHNGFSSLPFTNCVDLMPTPVKCDLTGNTNIDHKTLLDDALNGAQASTQLDLKCNRSASVTVKATRTNSYGVSLRGDTLYSEVKLNGMNATDGINISATDNWSTPINITSTLKTRGTVTPGPFSGSTVITVSPN